MPLNEPAPNPIPDDRRFTRVYHDTNAYLAADNGDPDATTWMSIALQADGTTILTVTPAAGVSLSPQLAYTLGARLMKWATLDWTHNPRTGETK